MILYHGTTQKKGQEIIKSGKIKSKIKRNYENTSGVIKNTTDGYVCRAAN